MARYLHLYHVVHQSARMSEDEVNERGERGRRCRDHSFISNTKTTSGTYVMNSSYSTPPPTVDRKKSKHKSNVNFSIQQSRQQQQEEECDESLRQTNVNTNYHSIAVLEQLNRAEKV